MIPPVCWFGAQGALSVLPHADIGFAVIFLTVGVKILLFPVAKQAIYTQIALKKIAPEVEKIKKEVTDQKEQVTQMLAVYKANGEDRQDANERIVQRNKYNRVEEFNHQG
jgi:membrane protein insertase Oxa1/YidC/SpoIIIJ